MSGRWLLLAACGLLVAGVAGCGGGGNATGLSGTVRIDGSSTLLPVAQAAAEDFEKANPEVDVTVRESGADRGFEELCDGEIDIAAVARPIAPAEAAACGRGGVAYTGLQVASDGTSVIASPELGVRCLDKGQLGRLWGRASRVSRLSELGTDADTGKPLPTTELSLNGPASDSDTFEFFTERVTGVAGDSRDDYATGDDDALTKRVAGEDGGIGYVDFAGYAASEDDLGLVGVDGGNGCVTPSTETIQDGSYYLTRPLSMYPSATALAGNPALQPFLELVEDDHGAIAESADAVPMSAEAAAKSREQLRSLTQG
jgi:phosphate transport system substrate-binding protein